MYYYLIHVYLMYIIKCEKKLCVKINFKSDWNDMHKYSPTGSHKQLLFDIIVFILRVKKWRHSWLNWTYGWSNGGWCLWSASNSLPSSKPAGSDLTGWCEPRWKIRVENARTRYFTRLLPEQKRFSRQELTWSFLVLWDEATWARYWMTFLVFSVFPAPDSPLNTQTDTSETSSTDFMDKS